MLAQEHGSDGISRTDHLLFLIVDLLALSNWMRSKDGQKNRNRPKPISPLAAKNQRGTTTTYGKTDLSPEEAKALLALTGPRPVHDHCNNLTRKGTPCRGKPMAGTATCWAHRPTDDEEVTN